MGVGWVVYPPGSSVVTWYKEGQVLSADSFLVLQVSHLLHTLYSTLDIVQ